MSSVLSASCTLPESLQVDFREEQQQWLVSCVQVDRPIDSVSVYAR